MRKKGKRFPEIEWFCDRCHQKLDNQSGFDDRHYVWKCSNCGHKNSISSDNIYASYEEFRRGKKQNR